MTAARLDSLDQFRGYTVAGMFLVNFLGNFHATPLILKHHNTYNSYADTIMPHFFFAVGFALRLAHSRRVEQVGARAATLRVLRRVALLVLLSAVVYHLGADSWRELFRGEPWRWIKLLFQTLTHIAVTTLWVLPVVRARPAVLLAFATFSGLLHLGLSHAFYMEWALRRGVIDGGPLGFLTWAIPTLAGAWACELNRVRGPRGSLGPLLAAGTVLAVIGIALSFLGETRTLPFVHRTGPIELWTMSQKTGALSYQVFSAGFSLAVYALFVVACDLRGLKLGVFRTLGGNALAGYILHGFIMLVLKHESLGWFPKTASMLVACLGCALAFGIAWGILRLLEWKGWYLRL